MQKKTLVLVLLILVLFGLFGCNQAPFCGDNICNSTETQYTCPGDCGKPSDLGHLEVILTDANTGKPIIGANVIVAENILPNGCGIDLSNPTPTVKAITNEQGIAKFGIVAGKEYYSDPNNSGYTNVAYQCNKIYPSETASVKYSLVQLPPVPLKPKCTEQAGTTELAVGDSINVMGGYQFPNQIMNLKLNDFLMTSSAPITQDSDWQTRIFAKWSIDINKTPLKYIERSPVVSLRDEFGTLLMSQEVTYLGNCWKSSEGLPYAIITKPKEIPVISAALVKDISAINFISPPEDTFMNVEIYATSADRVQLFSTSSIKTYYGMRIFAPAGGGYKYADTGTKDSNAKALVVNYRILSRTPERAIIPQKDFNYQYLGVDDKLAFMKVCMPKISDVPYNNQTPVTLIYYVSKDGSTYTDSTFAKIAQKCN
jgi:hypothetical protein